MNKPTQKQLLYVAISALMGHSSVNAADWVITAPETINGGHEQDIVVINQEVTGSSVGITLNEVIAGISITTSGSLAPTGVHDAIYISSTGNLIGNIVNNGYLLGDLGIKGRISANNNSALVIEGSSLTDLATAETIRTELGSYVSSQQGQVFEVGEFGFLESITIADGSLIETSGTNNSAILIGQGGVLGGDLNFTPPEGGTITADGSDADAIITIKGNVKSDNGSGVLINGSAYGVIFVDDGATISGGSGGAIAVDGLLRGSIKNYKGNISGGIRISGTHHASALANVDGVAPELTTGDRSAYISKGTSDKKAELTGGIIIESGGESLTSDNHAIYLDEYSMVDVVGVTGLLKTSAINKSAIYVGENAVLGHDADLAAVAVFEGGEIASARGAAIDVAGKVNGVVWNNGGVISAESTSEDAIEFTNADTALYFLQQGGSAQTTGSIKGSALATDTVRLSGGSINSDSIEGIEKLILDGGEIGVVNLSGMEQLTIYSNALTVNENLTGSSESDDLIQIVGGTVTANTVSDIEAILLAGGSLETDSISGLMDMTVSASTLDVDGAIEGSSAQGSDRMNFIGGIAKASEISGIENILVDGGTLEAGSISGLNEFTVLRGLAKVSDDFIGTGSADSLLKVQGGNLQTGAISGFETMLLSAGNVQASSLSGLEELEVTTGALLAVAGNTTIPAQTTINVKEGYNPQTPVIQVEGELTVSQGAILTVNPVTAAAFNEFVANKELTVLHYNTEEASGVANHFTAEHAEIDNNHLLFDLNVISDPGVLKVAIDKRDVSTIFQGTDTTKQEQDLLLNALVAAADSGGDTSKQEVIIPLLTYDHRKALLNGLKLAKAPTATGTMAVHNAIQTRIQVSTTAGVAYGDSGYNSSNYYSQSQGPGFSFMEGDGWGQFLYSTSRHDSVDGSNSYDGRMTGFVFGMDMDITNTFRVGGAGSWTNNTLTGKGNNSSTDTHNFLATVYGHWYLNGWYSNAILSAGIGTSDTGRVILGQDVKGSYKSHSLGARFVLGHVFGIDQWNFMPEAELHYGKMTFDAYEETGSSGFEKKIAIKDYDIMEVGFGFRMGLPTELGYSLRPEFNLMGYYDVKNTGTEIKASYLAGGDDFTVSGPSRDKMRLKTGLKVDWDIFDSWTLNAAYNMNWSKHFLSHNVSAKAKYEF